MASRYRKGNEPFDDLVQVASLGQVKALERWDPDRGTAFSTFAVPTILGELRRCFRDSTWAVRPPRGPQELAQQVAQARDRLWQELGRAPAQGEVAVALGRSDEEVLDGLEAGAAQYADSLDAPLADQEGASATRLEQLGASDPGYANVEARAMVDELASVLDTRARLVLRLRFREGLLQREIADRVGCSADACLAHPARLARPAGDVARRDRPGTRDGSARRAVGRRTPTGKFG